MARTRKKTKPDTGAPDEDAAAVLAGIEEMAYHPPLSWSPERTGAVAADLLDADLLDTDLLDGDPLDLDRPHPDPLDVDLGPLDPQPLAEGEPLAYAETLAYVRRLARAGAPADDDPLAHRDGLDDPFAARDSPAYREAHLVNGFGAVIDRSAPGAATSDATWGRRLRRGARVAVWSLPAAAACLALAGIWGWPAMGRDPAGVSPGTWLVVTVSGLVLGLVGVVAMSALLASNGGRRWSLVALGAALTGTVLLAPVLGVIGLARPSLTRVAASLPPGVAADLEHRIVQGTVSRWLGLTGLVLLAAGWLALGCAVIASRVLNRADGYLLGGMVAIAILGGYLGWRFLLVVAAMVLLAATLGLAWTASRLTPEGARHPDDD